ANAARDRSRGDQRASHDRGGVQGVCPGAAGSGLDRSRRRRRAEYEGDPERVTRIAILNYGMGNLRSVEKALERIGAEALITADHEAARAADGVILPGVGAFPRAM